MKEEEIKENMIKLVESVGDEDKQIELLGIWIADMANALTRYQAENARLREALLKIDAYDPATYDGLTSYSYKLIAREALKGGE